MSSSQLPSSPSLSFPHVLLSGSFALGWGLSTYFRCTTLIIAPNVLGKEGRAYLVIFVIGTIYTGPVMNLQHNLDQIVKSIGCTVELQINHTQLIWKIMTNPLKKIVEDLVTGGKEMKSDSQNIMSEFEEMDSEVKSTEGYNQKIEKEQKEEVKANNKTLSTQRIVDLKTKLRCQYIIETGIDRCHDWFDKKHAECMRVLWLPVFNHILCLPMKFKFLCNILYLINPWCKKKLPVEGNFGQTYDKVNGTMNNMDNGFSTGMSVKRDDQEMFVGMNISELLITEEVLENISKRKVIMMKVVSFIKVILSCTFVYLFISAYNYCNKYNTNIRFDNVYVTTYFKQIDARRKKR
ncbi:hypothetical protein FKM82_021677, partial [Ascaphus truei]